MAKLISALTPDISGYRIYKAVADTRGGEGGRKSPPPIIFTEALVLKIGSARKFLFEEVEPLLI